MSLQSTARVALLGATIGAICWADVPVEGMYLIRSSKLATYLKLQNDVSGLTKSTLEKISECRVFVGDGYVNSFRFGAKGCDFVFKTSYGHTPPPPGGAGQDFSIEFIQSSKSIKVNGYLVFTDETLDAISSTPLSVDGIPNAYIRINRNWRAQDYAVLVLFVNAKH
jgi:hypothetical protein